MCSQDICQHESSAAEPKGASQGQHNAGQVPVARRLSASVNPCPPNASAAKPVSTGARPKSTVSWRGMTEEESAAEWHDHVIKGKHVDANGNFRSEQILHSLSLQLSC